MAEEKKEQSGCDTKKCQPCSDLRVFVLALLAAAIVVVGYHCARMVMRSYRMKQQAKIGKVVPRRRGGKPGRCCCAPGKGIPGKGIPCRCCCAPGKRVPCKCAPGKCAPGKCVPGKTAPCKCGKRGGRCTPPAPAPRPAAPAARPTPAPAAPAPQSAPAPAAPTAPANK